MSADFEDGMDGEQEVEVKEFAGVTVDSRIYFDGAQFPELVSGKRDESGFIEFTGRICFEIEGWAIRAVINGTTVNGSPAYLEGGISGMTLWKQGRTEESAVNGFIEDIGDGLFVIHPETIEAN